MEEKIFVNSDMMATFTCPECQRSQRKDVSEFVRNETNVRLKYTCPCKYTFSVVLERRRSVRKDVRLAGRIKSVNRDGQVILTQKKYPVVIKNLSIHGMRFTKLNKYPLEQGQAIEIEFTLDNRNRATVSKKVLVIKLVSPSEIGCEFISYDHHGSLGKYFLFHFS